MFIDCMVTPIQMTCQSRLGLWVRLTVSVVAQPSPPATSGSVVARASRPCVGCTIRRGGTPVPLRIRRRRSDPGGPDRPELACEKNKTQASNQHAAPSQPTGLGRTGERATSPSSRTANFAFFVTASRMPFAHMQMGPQTRTERGHSLDSHGKTRILWFIEANDKQSFHLRHPGWQTDPGDRLR